MFCISCGTKHLAGAKFCQQCGSSLEGSIGKSPGEIEGASPEKVNLEPADSQEKPVVTLTEVNNSSAWAMALAPLLFAITDVALSTTMDPGAVTGWGFAVAFAVNSILVLVDSKALEKNGLEPSRFLGFVLMPAYLFHRSKMLGRTQAPLTLWFATFALSIAIPYISAATVGTQVSTSATESAITDWLNSKGYPDAKVSCPSSVLSKPGAVFDCLANGTGLNSVDIQVTVQNTNGDIVWKAVY